MYKSDNKQTKQSTLFKSAHDIPTFVKFYNAAGVIREGEYR